MSGRPESAVVVVPVSERLNKIDEHIVDLIKVGERQISDRNQLQAIDSILTDHTTRIGELEGRVRSSVSAVISPC